MNKEINTYIESIAKRIYPLTEKEKNCIEKYGQMVINRGHVKKAIIETISKYKINDGSSSKSQQEDD